MQIYCPSLEELPQATRELLAWADENDRTNVRVWTFEGDLGAGKTTLIQEICRQQGVTDRVSSPSFALVNEYQRADGMPVYHFDFYRIESEEEAVDIGTEEYFESGTLCLVEWPSRIPHLLPPQHLKISISVDTMADATHHARIYTLSA
ncbi:tRNA threonylcarbamoyladenosine biosynthesis protein TsaE [Catalinimonas alkaloidigena]|uniref:tRNA threonylcarbamoyladenosine biosynthesis protein TsaE n=1 Tax=Catalinimonas alkaloidigena TaxID=1075417 RepID=A0A1G9D6L7_9BACT|nr:tRNA (adenosine(37)-N6)-threonylcarbamoyltransferase complex ATPase subunit type 1 TsaE [Catalinimonas alkaloidigena]SDK59527.1 tRNA threonylcarbamoyladenosine biosynthesis protein TsaE [Catalinimonas alkaloidigena]